MQETGKEKRGKSSFTSLVLVFCCSWEKVFRFRTFSKVRKTLENPGYVHSRLNVLTTLQIPSRRFSLKFHSSDKMNKICLLHATGLFINHIFYDAHSFLSVCLLSRGRQEIWVNRADKPTLTFLCTLLLPFAWSFEQVSQLFDNFFFIMDSVLAGQWY